MSFCFELEENEKQEVTYLRLKPNWWTAGPIATYSYVTTWCIVSQHVWIFLYTFSGYVSICEEGPVQATRELPQPYQR